MFINNLIVEKFLNPLMSNDKNWTHSLKRIQHYTDFSGEIDGLKGKHEIIVDIEKSPVISPSRRIITSFKIKLNDKSDRMVKTKIITPIILNLQIC